jgi:hypothetical protein
MISCVPWALSHITGLDVPVIEAILSHRRDDGVKIAQDGAITAVNPRVAERILQLLGFDTVMAVGGMTAAEAAQISSEFPSSAFYFSLSCDHAVVAQDGKLFDNGHPTGIAGDQHPFSGEVDRGVICMSRSR